MKRFDGVIIGEGRKDEGKERKVGRKERKGEEYKGIQELLHFCVCMCACMCVF